MGAGQEAAELMVTGEGYGCGKVSKAAVYPRLCQSALSKDLQ